MLFRTLNFILLRRCIQYLSFQPEARKLLHKISRNILVGTTQVFVGANLSYLVSCTPIKIEKMDIEEVEKALHEGDMAIMKLMDELKDFVKVVSDEYRKCLYKQIEITEKSQSIGPFSETWDELPKYRTLADELLQQLNNYKALFETLGKMAEDKFSFNVSQDQSLVTKINQKFKEAQELIQQEFEENKNLEMKLLQANCDTILMDVLIDDNQK